MERLDLRLVDYFVAVAEELHFGRAAARLHIAQPSLSQQIRRLEGQLGVTLLDRTSRRVELTPAGTVLLREGGKVLSQSRRALQAVRAAGGERITVGFFGSAGSTLLPEVLSAFGQLQPAVEVTIRELLLGSVAEIADGRVDVAFTRLLPGQTDLEVEILARETRIAALPAAHPLAARESLAFAELREDSFITNPAVRDGGAPARWLDEQRRHGLPGRVGAQAASIQEILTLVAAGRGVCLVPAPVASGNARADVAFVPVRDADPAVVSIAWNGGEDLRPAARAFIEVARSTARPPQDPG